MLPGKQTMITTWVGVQICQRTTLSSPTPFLPARNTKFAYRHQLNCCQRFPRTRPSRDVLTRKFMQPKKLTKKVTTADLRKQSTTFVVMKKG